MPHDPAVPDAHVGFDDALHRVDDGDVGDDEIKHAGIAVQAGIAAMPPRRVLPPPYMDSSP